MFFFSQSNTELPLAAEALGDKLASSSCTSLACSLIIALKEPVNKVLEASLESPSAALPA